MDISHSHDFHASPDDISALFADESFARARSDASGAAHSDAIVDGTPATGFSVSIRQSVPASSIPSEVRPFVGSELNVRFTEVWDPATAGARTGTFAVEIVGTPGHASGSLRLDPHGDITQFTVDGAVSVRVPLVGPMIEKAVATAVIKALREELVTADEWLARR
ncbi:DUF2505 domain-containing protein [Demequina sp. SO4-13]|uniref:DUF2505 domain-containing protein n=1 Tax=Demequina sp. SO4-13 TaxID=3401027 RepID=UPI003AF62567